MNYPLKVDISSGLCYNYQHKSGRKSRMLRDRRIRNMIKKLTVKVWRDVMILSLIIGVIPSIVLIKFAPTAIQALCGSVPDSAKAESISNTYVICLFALFFIVIDVLVVINHFTHSVGKKVKRYLAENPGVTMEQLESDFETAEQLEDVWIGRKWTFGESMDYIPVEHDKIVLVYSESWRSKRFETFYLCLGLLDGTVVKTIVREKTLPKFMELYGRYPHILVGNNYIQMFKNNRKALLDIKYRSGQN